MSDLKTLKQNIYRGVIGCREATAGIALAPDLMCMLPGLQSRASWNPAASTPGLTPGSLRPSRSPSLEGRHGGAWGSLLPVQAHPAISPSIWRAPYLLELLNLTHCVTVTYIYVTQCALPPNAQCTMLKPNTSLQAPPLWLGRACLAARCRLPAALACVSWIFWFLTHVRCVSPYSPCFSVSAAAAASQQQQQGVLGASPV